MVHWCWNYARLQYVSDAIFGRGESSEWCVSADVFRFLFSCIFASQIYKCCAFVKFWQLKVFIVHGDLVTLDCVYLRLTKIAFRIVCGSKSSNVEVFLPWMVLDSIQIRSIRGLVFKENAFFFFWPT